MLIPFPVQMKGGVGMPVVDNRYILCPYLRQPLNPEQTAYITANHPAEPCTTEYNPMNFTPEKRADLCAFLGVDEAELEELYR